MTRFSRNKEKVDFDYSLQRSVLDSKARVQDLSILLSRDLSSEEHKKMLNMSYRTLSQIHRTFGSDIPILVKRKLYISFVKLLFQ